MHVKLAGILVSILLQAGTATLTAAPAAKAESAANAPKTLDTPRTFPEICSRAEWESRASQIRERVLVSCGLWPLPEKTPLNAQVFGRVEREGYTVEKVCIQTLPGFYLGGNLYRPLGKGKGQFPGILNPHGHWKEGRFADTKDGSIAGRCINFARQGMVAFSYDMVGFNDTQFAGAPTNRPYYEIHRSFGKNPADQLWNISLMGLQTWNSIWALDFLASLPDVDRKRLACTGESGGGTQTFMLGAIDARLAAQAPIVMVSHTMQGGCSCENAPGLRVEHSNMEIAASAAPRPQFLVAATGDWTKTTLEVEGPAIAGIYKLFGATDRFGYVRFDFNHNYNETSREAVYGFFNKWLLGKRSSTAIPEIAFKKEPDADLRAFPSGTPPGGTVTQEQMLAFLKHRQEAQWDALRPQNAKAFKRFAEAATPAWRHNLQLPFSEASVLVQSEPSELKSGFNTRVLKIRRAGEEGFIRATSWVPKSRSGEAGGKLAILCQGDPTGEQDKQPPAIVVQLLNMGVQVLLLQQFSGTTFPDQFANFYTTYNRTKVQQRVRDLVTLCRAAIPGEGKEPAFSKPILIGTGAAGLWALLAAPAAGAVVADCGGLNVGDEQALLGPDVFFPGILAMGGPDTAAALAAPRPLLLHNTGSTFGTKTIGSAYAALNSRERLGVHATELSASDLARWVSGVE